MSGPDPRELNELMKKLQPSVIILADSWRESGCADRFASSVVVAGTQAGVRAVVPAHAGRATYAVVMAPRADVVARLRAVGHGDVAAVVGAGATEGPNTIDVVVATESWVAVVDLVPDPSTAPGGAA